MFYKEILEEVDPGIAALVFLKRNRLIYAVWSSQTNTFSNSTSVFARFLKSTIYISDFQNKKGVNRGRRVEAKHIGSA